MSNRSTGIAAAFSQLTPPQRRTFVASFLGWSLDAFDYFILVFVIPEVAKDFAASVAAVTYALLLTLALRPVGALLFGFLADRFGRRPVLMADILFYSVVEFASGLAPSLGALLVLRALYGIAMGGEWGVGASLAMESVPSRSRGALSGLLQQGYPFGYLLAALVGVWVLPHLGWRWMFFVGVLPALVVLYIRSAVSESAVWQRVRSAPMPIKTVIAKHWHLMTYVVVLMTTFNFFSHGTQDLYPTFLKVQRHLSQATTQLVAIVYNVGALLGGVTFGALSESLGRRRAVVIAALSSIPIIPLWVFAPSVGWLAVGAFIMQFMVQGAWGVIPAHLGELSPPAMRATFSGATYQLGNLFAAYNATLQASLASRYGGNYALAMAVVVFVVALSVAIVTALGIERRGVDFAQQLGTDPK